VGSQEVTLLVADMVGPIILSLRCFFQPKAHLRELGEGGLRYCERIRIGVGHSWFHPRVAASARQPPDLGLASNS